MRCQPVDLSRIAADVVSELRESWPERKVDFRTQEAMTAWGDPRLLRVVLVNLIGNAWKYTGKKERASIEFGCRHDKDRKVWFIRDDGVGFDMNYADRLFGTFQRLHHTGDFEGTGIGLATVQRIIIRHDGKIWGEGTVGSGATFYFTLPEGPIMGHSPSHDPSA
jgi:light-regulated signal transduction histidine kinase (bacteriophytochrome)